MVFRKNGWAAKIKRNVMAVFFPVSEKRSGKCLQCGKCCTLPVKCVFLKELGGKAYCSAYKYRPPSCRKYPRTESEWLTSKTCGYSFGACAGKPVSESRRN